MGKLWSNSWLHSMYPLGRCHTYKHWSFFLNAGVQNDREILARGAAQLWVCAHVTICAPHVFDARKQLAQPVATLSRKHSHKNGSFLIKRSWKINGDIKHLNRQYGRNRPNERQACCMVQVLIDLTLCDKRGVKWCVCSVIKIRVVVSCFHDRRQVWSPSLRCTPVIPTYVSEQTCWLALAIQRIQENSCRTCALRTVCTYGSLSKMPIGLIYNARVHSWNGLQTRQLHTTFWKDVNQTPVRVNS